MKLKFFPAVVFASTAFIGSAHAAPEDKPFDFKGIPLEITLEEFRTLPHPDGDPARVVCTGEEIGGAYKSEPIDVMVFSEDERTAGVVKCIWVGKNGYGNGESIIGLSLAGSGYATNSYSFSFVKDTIDGRMRLFKYEGKTNVNAADDVIEALTKKWGKPKITQGSVQNQMGSTFDKIEAFWINSKSSILVRTRFTKIDNMAILFLSDRLNKIIVETEQERKGKLKNGI